MNRDTLSVALAYTIGLAGLLAWILFLVRLAELLSGGVR